MTSGFKILKVGRRSHDKIWRPLWGPDEKVRNHYNELSLNLEEQAAPSRKLKLVFRIFNDGLGFRYILPKQKQLSKFVITSEETYFNLADDHDCFWIPDDYDAYEMLYTHSRCSRIGTGPMASYHHPHSNKTTPNRGANTPLTMKTNTGVYLSFHEAALEDYAGMTLVPQKKPRHSFKAVLVPWPNGDKVRGVTPFKTPWRTIIVANRPGGLIESNLVLNLNRPSRLKRTQFIKPMKFVGIWWSMHLGITTWGKKGGRHGATTVEAKRHIDFAARHNIPGVLIEGWNEGWESWGQDDNFDFTTPYDDFDLKAVAAYAKQRGVFLIGHHETGGQFESYERRLDQAFSLYQKLGIRAVKTGYAGKIRPLGFHHHGQRMVRHYNKVIRKAAQYGIMLDVHEPIKPTGLRRTYPNLMASEGVRGTEWNAWSHGNPPEHTATVPFTRMLAGPLDFTLGIFDLTYQRFADQYRFWNPIDGLKTRGKMSTTLAKQLAYFVVLYSPLQMAADMIENYESHPGFQFIRDVPVTWSETHVLGGEIGEFVTIARRKKNSNDWFIGSLTNKKPRTLTINFDFLKAGTPYVATIYQDGKKAHFRKNPTALEVTRRMVKRGQRQRFWLAPGGGLAIYLHAAFDKHPATRTP